MRRCLPLLSLWLLISASLYADAPAFDLLGPKVDVRVKRGTVTLPISETPNLLPGDRLWIHPDLPESQSTHFVLVVAFLRGSTNPPPEQWFTRVETWTREAREEGVFVTVPDEAQQALIFLAPETGGDFNTLRKAVRGRPGAFVRATQDLEAASLDRMRLEAYLAEVKSTSQSDPKQLKEHSEMASRSLGIRLDQQCFDKPSDQQAPCLVQHTDGLVLDDTNAQSMVDQLANGSAGDLMNQLSYSSMGGGGLYSPYVGAIVDTAKILSSLHTAHFQYIPALALPTDDTLNLRLNVAPSFRDPKSVVVVAMPPIGPAKPLPLRPVNLAENFCALKPGLTLPAEGAPLVFGTRLVHNLTLHIEAPSGPIDVPVAAGASQGGLVFEHAVPTLPGGDLTGVVRGKYGFDDWEGPRFHLHVPQSGKWTLAAGDQSALVVGREDTVHLDGDSSLCVEKVEEQPATGNSVKLTWKSTKPETLEVAVPMKEAAPGPVTLAVYQYGLEKPDKLPLKAYAEAASLDRLTLNAGDPDAQLSGTRLDQVAQAEVRGIKLTPAALTRVGDMDLLAMNADASTSSLEPGKRYMANVQLLDGRQLKTPVTVAAPRPQVALLNKGSQDASTTAPSPVHLGSPDDLTVNGKLVFFLKSAVPPSFPRTERVEVAAVDGSFHTILSLDDGGLMLEDTRTAMGKLDPLLRFGSSAFGPVHLRAMSSDGTTGDWLPLGTLVRLPEFKELRCPHATSKPCTLSGNDLFLVASIGSTQNQEDATDVPPDFTGTQLTVPHPVNGVLYLWLRDDPDAVQTLTLPVTPTVPGAPVPAAYGPGQPGSTSQKSGPPAPAQPAVPANPPAAQTDAAATPQTGSPSTPPR